MTIYFHYSFLSLNVARVSAGNFAVVWCTAHVVKAAIVWLGWLSSMGSCGRPLLAAVGTVKAASFYLAIVAPQGLTRSWDASLVKPHLVGVLAAFIAVSQLYSLMLATWLERSRTFGIGLQQAAVI